MGKGWKTGEETDNQQCCLLRCIRLCFIYYYVLFMEPFVMKVCFRVCGCWNPPPPPSRRVVGLFPLPPTAFSHRFILSVTFRPRRAPSCCTRSPQLVSSNPAVVIADSFEFYRHICSSVCSRRTQLPPPPPRS